MPVMVLRRGIPPRSRDSFARGMRLIAALLATLSTSVSALTAPTFLDFGADFVFGVVQDSYQFEGSLTAGGAGVSHLHTWCAWNLNEPNNGGWKLCGDVGAGFYEHMREDVALMSALGQRHLHFQVAWQRIFPDGGEAPNEAGLAFYDALVDELVAHNITPWVSLEVFDFPQSFQSDWGGWLGLPMVAEYRRLAETLFSRLGDRVKRWFSFHEPNSLCASYPNGGRFIGPRPNVNDSSVQDPMRDHYTCTYVMLLAHAEAAAALRVSAHGADSEISIISDASWLEVNTTSAADAAAVDRYMVWRLGAWFEPLITGQWPPEMVLAAGDRLPAFTPAQSAALRNSTAAIGVNHYSSFIGAAVPDATFPCPTPQPGHTADAFEYDACVVLFCDSRCGPNPNPHLTWLHNHPPGMRAVLNWMSRRYPGTPILVAESGVGLDGGSGGDPLSSGDFDVDINDGAKIDYLRAYWTEAWLAKTVDGVDLRGIFHWSFLDNLEWNSGYSAHFGVVHVNHSRADLQRTPKTSALWLANVVARNGFEANLSLTV